MMNSNALKINDKSLKLLRQHVMVDSEISEEQRQHDLALIADVKAKLQTGEYTVIDRLSVIKRAAEKKIFRKKLKRKSRKARRNATADTVSVKSVDAFDEAFMCASDAEVRKYADGMGITDTYRETTRFDGEWN